MSPRSGGDAQIASALQPPQRCGPAKCQAGRLCGPQATLLGLVGGPSTAGCSCFFWGAGTPRAVWPVSSDGRPSAGGPLAPLPPPLSSPRAVPWARLLWARLKWVGGRRLESVLVVTGKATGAEDVPAPRGPARREEPISGGWPTPAPCWGVPSENARA